MTKIRRIVSAFNSFVSAALAVRRVCRSYLNRDIVAARRAEPNILIRERIARYMHWDLILYILTLVLAPLATVVFSEPLMWPSFVFIAITRRMARISHTELAMPLGNRTRNHRLRWHLYISVYCVQATTVPILASARWFPEAPMLAGFLAVDVVQGLVGLFWQRQIHTSASIISCITLHSCCAAHNDDDAQPGDKTLHAFVARRFVSDVLLVLLQATTLVFVLQENTNPVHLHVALALNVLVGTFLSSVEVVRQVFRNTAAWCCLPCYR